MFEGLKSNISKLMKKCDLKVVKKAIPVILFIVIFFIFATSFIRGKETKMESTKDDQNIISAIAYCEMVENRLISVLENVKGIGKVDAFVMVDESPTIKYLEERDVQNNNIEGKDEVESIKTTIVLVKNGSVTSPVVVVEILPKITGVLVVAEGAKDIKLKTNLINIISSVLSVDVSKVEVMEGGS